MSASAAGRVAHRTRHSPACAGCALAVMTAATSNASTHAPPSRTGASASLRRARSRDGDDGGLGSTCAGREEEEERAQEREAQCREHHRVHHGTRDDTERRAQNRQERRTGTAGRAAHASTIGIAIGAHEFLCGDVRQSAHDRRDARVLRSELLRSPSPAYCGSKTMCALCRSRIGAARMPRRLPAGGPHRAIGTCCRRRHRRSRPDRSPTPARAGADAGRSGRRRPGNGERTPG